MDEKRGETFGVPEEIAPPEQENERTENQGPTKDNAEMYRLPNDPPLTDKDLERYAKTRTRTEEILPELVERNFDTYLNSEHYRTRQWAIENLETLGPELTEERLEKYLNSEYREVRKWAYGHLELLPEKERPPYVKKAVKDLSPSNSEEIQQLLDLVEKDEKTRILGEQ